MAKASGLKVSIEAIVHNSMKEAAHTLMDDYGVQLENVSFQWTNDLSSVNSILVSDVSLITNKKY